MILLDPKLVNIKESLLFDIDNKARSIFRAITFCKKTSSKSLLDAFINSTNSLTQLLSIKNAQMEAETEEDLIEYQANLNKTILFVIGEIKNEIPFESQVQLFQIFRLISPQSHQKHPNKYRNTLVQIGRLICPDPNQLNGLVSQLFVNLKQLKHPLLKAIYLHHELIRIHPFVDGNGRIVRIAKNWILMYNLYPPIFIKDEAEKIEYIRSLSESFEKMYDKPGLWHKETERFFMEELNRVLLSIDYIHDKLKESGSY